MWIAVSVDQLGNVICGRLFNDIMITKNWYLFWDEDETISSCIWKNKKNGTLKFCGKVLDTILDAIDPGHSIKSIE